VHLWSSQDWVCSDQRLSQAKLKVEIDNATPIVWVENGASEGKTKIDKVHDFDNMIATITIAEYLFDQCIVLPIKIKTKMLNNFLKIFLENKIKYSK